MDIDGVFLAFKLVACSGTSVQFYSRAYPLGENMEQHSTR